MADSTSTSSDRRKIVWGRVYPDLLQHAVPDSRFNYDFLSFTPDFRGSSSATDRIVKLPAYTSARTLLVTPDNSLENLRHRALKDGKKLLVATYRLRRGFLLLEPSWIDESKLEIASWLDGMERPGVGRALTVAQIQEEGIKVDMCVTGGLAFNQDGVVVWEGSSLFEVQWAILFDTKVLVQDTPVVAVVHECQVVDEEAMSLEKFKPEKAGEVQCDFVVTPERVIEVGNAVKPNAAIDFDTIDEDALNTIPPLQELKGMRMMDQIMKNGGLSEESKKLEPKKPSSEEQLGIGMVERLLKAYKV